MKVLVTGGAGFVGVHVVARLLEWPHVTEVIALDIGRHTAAPQALPASDRVSLIDGSVLDRPVVDLLVEQCDMIIHLAAETFVDNSIADDSLFVSTNIEGTAVLLRAMRKFAGRRLVHVSTDEVFGETAGSPFTETSPYAPRNPYAATKAAADHLVRAYVNTYRLDAVICHFSNLYGPWQYPEKLIPVTVARLLADQPAKVYGTGEQSRTYLHVDDAAVGVLRVLEHGCRGGSYLIGGTQEVTNLAVVQRITELTGIDRPLWFVPDRPGGDVRSIPGSDGHAVGVARAVAAEIRRACGP
jgi:dTDP-glucose 4,6-dehydratase